MKGLNLPGTKMLISFIIPVYNEEERVGQAIEFLNKYLKAVSFDAEVIFVNDGSKDKTGEVINSSKPKFSFRIINYYPNRGKGFAVKTGMLAAQGDYRLLIDVDMSTPIEEFDKFVPLLSPEKIIIGTRKGKVSKVLKRQPIWRQKMGEVYTLMANFLIARGVSDFTCGFKVFPREAAKRVFEKSRIERWSYDAEIIFLALKFGYKLEELGVVWQDDKRTRVKLARDSLKSLIDLLIIRGNEFLGKYS